MREYFNVALGRWQVVLADGTRTYRYRHMMEEHLGRKLATDEHVHHINGDPTDDRLENLQVLGEAEHHRLHAPDSAAAQRAKWEHEWSAKHPHCVECGTTDRRHEARGMCSRCYFTIRQREAGGHEPRKPATVLDLTCEHCGDEFQRTLKQGKGKYCSRSCASKASSRRRWARRAAGDGDHLIGRRRAA